MAKSDDYWIHDESYRRFFCCQGVSATSDRFTAASSWGNACSGSKGRFTSSASIRLTTKKTSHSLLFASSAVKVFHFRKIPVAPSFAKTGFYSERSSPAAYRNTSGTALAQDRHDDMCQDVTVQRNSQRMVAHLLQRPLGHTYH